MTSLSGPIWVGLGSKGGGLSDVVQISMKNYHITASNSALESPSVAKFNALTFKVIEKLQKGRRWRNYQDPLGSVLGLGEGGCQMWCRLP